MNKIQALLFFLLLTTAAMAQQNKPQLSTEKQVLVLSFFSVGSGINGPAFSEVHDAIDAYNKKYTPRLKYYEKQWGMEGEHNICFPPQKGRHFRQFITGLEKQCRAYEHVNIRKNEPCLN